MRGTTLPVRLTLVPLAALALAACGDNPVEPGEDHFNPVGMRVVIDGQTVVTVDQGQVTGSITVEEGDEVDIVVEFIDDDGDVIVAPVDEYYLAVDIDDETIAHFQRVGQFDGHIEGEGEGATTARFMLIHGDPADDHGHDDDDDDGHADYTSPFITITVTAAIGG